MGFLNNIDKDRIPKLIAEGILPQNYGQILPNTNLGQPRPVLQPPMTSVSGGVNSFPNAFDPGSQLGNGTIRTGINPGGQFVQPGFGGLPGANQGINLPISIGNNPSLNPIQDQMFRPPMQQPVQNQMPVANSFLEQLQQSAGLLQNQVTALQPSVVNNVPQNRFVGNQFQMPFGMGQPTPFGGNYGSGGFNLPYNPGSYTPRAFNQYGNIGTTAGIDNIISSLLGLGADRGGEGDAGGMFGGVQGQNDPSNPRNRQDRYDKNPDGSITQYDASTGLTTTYDLDDEGLTLAQQLFGNIAKVPTTASLVESAVGGLIGNLTDTGFDVNSNMPSNQLENPTNNPLIASYNQMITENIPGLPVSPINIPEIDLSLPTGLLTGVDQGPTNEFGRTRAEQDAVNDSVNIGNPDGTINVGFGQNAEGDYAGLVTGGPNNSPVTTGFTNNTASINNPNAVAAITANRDRRGRGAGGTVGGSNQGGYGDGAGGACFDPNTYIKMQDGSEKKIKDVQLGDFTKGGKVTGVLQFEPIDDIHEYKGVIVAGSHFVKEGNEFIMVQDSPESIKINKIPVVYSLDTSNRRIFINDIEFADYNGDGIAKNFLNNAGIDLSGFDKEVLRQVEHRLI